jgi:hypothetical protein
LSTEYYNRLGCIPWAKIAENPDQFLSKNSRPQSDHTLQEPSRMTEATVNKWLEHWVARQGRGRLPLILIDPSTSSVSKDVSKGSNKKGKKRIEWVDPDDDADDVVDGDTTSNGGESTGQSPGTPLPHGQHSGRVPGGPPVPADFAETRKDRRTFLGTLSEDGEYCRLLSLLDSAKVLSSILLLVCGN